VQKYTKAVQVLKNFQTKYLFQDGRRFRDVEGCILEREREII
jgi:hypothetical protein